MSVFNSFCLFNQIIRTCVILLLLSLNAIVCFNLETRLPITKFGRNGSYFGYSVAAHRSTDQQKLENNYWLLIGAPLDQNIQPNTNKSGALWKCPLTTKVNDCEQVVTDGKRKSSSSRPSYYEKNIDSNELLAPLADEIKDDQWLGVSVKSQEPGGKVIVCAHRYVRIDPGVDRPRYARGLCYILGPTLDYENHYEPCSGLNSADEFAYSYCQTGTSSLLLDDNTAVMGSPGNNKWAGNLFIVSVNDDVLHSDKTVYHASHDSPVADKYSLLGMAVTGGEFFANKQMAYAAGAPRSNGTGQVMLFTRKMHIANEKDPGIMDVRLVLSGEQIGSSFGYELTTADVNGDKKLDLIVGAPFYFDQESGGAVYIYMNTAKYCLNCVAPVRLTGKPESRFGIALSNLGDLNRDGYDDIAVGAPYQGNGVVYIYLGSKDGLVAEPSQIIEASSIPMPPGMVLHTWGSSLSSGVDMDQNGYPDLLVGAYESGGAVLLRARPIISLATSLEPEFNLRNIDPSKVGCSSDPKSNHTCFTFEACCTIESLNSSSINRRNGKLTLRYRLEAETFVPSQKFSRVFFGPNKEAKSHILEETVDLRPGELKHCRQHTAYIKENTKDIQSPIRIKLAYSLVQKEPKKVRPGDPLQSIDEFPILDQTAASRTFQATFHTDCGLDEICEAQLHVEADLKLEGRNGSYYELLLGQHQEVHLNISVHNFKEAAYEAQLFIAHHPRLSYISLQEAKGVICNPYNASLVACTLGNPFKTGAGAHFKVRFDPQGLGEEPELLFTVWANSTSKEIEKEEPLVLRAVIVRKAELSLTGTHRPEQVFYGGSPPTQRPLYLDEVGTRLVHTYQVFNAGPWRLSSLDISVDWPYQVAEEEGREGKPLLYLEDVPQVDGLGGGKCIVHSQVNPLDLYQRPDFLELDVPETTNSTGFASHRRVKRDKSTLTVRPEVYTDPDGRKHSIVNMDCLLGTARCIKITCNVYNLYANHEATITIRARLWNATLVEDYPHVDKVYIASRAKIHIPLALFLHQENLADDETQVKTVAIREIHESRTLWPIILLAILLGLLLLILLILFLRRIGFFRRHRHPPSDPTLSGNLRSAGSDDDDDEDY